MIILKRLFVVFVLILFLLFLLPYYTSPAPVINQEPVIDFHFCAECPDDDSERFWGEIQCGCETKNESAPAVIHKKENKPKPKFIPGMDMIKQPTRSGGGLRLSRRRTKKGIGSSSLKMKTT